MCTKKQLKTRFTWRELSARSVTGKPPKSRTDKFLSEERSITPFADTPVSEMHNFSKVVIVRRCLMPASVTLEHLERSNSLKLSSPNSNPVNTSKGKTFSKTEFYMNASIH